MGFFHLLLIVFLTVPVIEIFLLLQIGSIIHPLPTILLIIITAVIGAALVRRQGIATVQRMQSQLQRAELPAMELLEGAIVLIAGALLLTPGFLTDAMGFLCLVPPLRRFIIQKIIERYIKPRVLGSKPATPRQQDKNSIEGEYWRDD